MTRDSKTTILGACLAALVFAQPLITSQTFDIAKDWPNLVVGGLIAWITFYIGKKP